jgi:hypothetical protein
VPEYCRWTPAERSPLLQEAGVVDDQHRLTFTEMLDDVVAYVVQDLVGVPLDTVE